MWGLFRDYRIVDDAFAVSQMPEIGLSGSVWPGPETERWQAYSGTKSETADTDKASLKRAAPAPDPTTVPRSGTPMTTAVATTQSVMARPGKVQKEAEEVANVAARD